MLVDAMKDGAVLCFYAVSFLSPDSTHRFIKVTGICVRDAKRASKFRAVIRHDEKAVETFESLTKGESVVIPCETYVSIAKPMTAKETLTLCLKVSSRSCPKDLRGRTLSHKNRDPATT